MFFLLFFFYIFYSIKIESYHYFFFFFPAVFYFLYNKTGSLYFQVVIGVCILVLEAMSGTCGTRVAHKKGSLRDTLHKRAEATLTRYCFG